MSKGKARKWNDEYREFHRRIQGGAKGAEAPLNVFRCVFWLMVLDTETSIDVIFLDSL